jgi:imidazolonepropionase-like amidohydrolase
VQFAAPEVLRKAGVKVVFATGTASESLVKNLPYHARRRWRLDSRGRGAQGITLYPAQVAGVADRLGSIETGKEATVFATDGDILDIRSNVKRMWIAARKSVWKAGTRGCTRNTRIGPRPVNPRTFSAA